jgi:hypothetical protein
MGGFGSGRTASNPTVERALKLDMTKLLALGQVRPGAHVAGSIEWTWVASGASLATIGFEADLTGTEVGWLHLRYTTTTAHDGAKTNNSYRIALDTTRLHYGGRRWWFVCPVTGRRARVLYLPLDGSGATFASRGVHRLSYLSQRQGDVDNAIDRSVAIRRKLGVTDMNTLHMPFAPKPKWMRSHTHQRLLAELRDIQAVLVGNLAKRLGMEWEP